MQKELHFVSGFVVTELFKITIDDCDAKPSVINMHSFLKFWVAWGELHGCAENWKGK